VTDSGTPIPAASSRPLRQTLGIGITAAFMALAAVLVLLYARETLDAERTAFVHEQQVKAATLGLFVAQALERGDFAFLERYSELLRADPDLIGIEIRDARGGIIADYPGANRDTDAGGGILVEKAIHGLTGDALGTLVLRFSDVPLRAALRQRLLWGSAAVLGFGLLFGFSVFAFLSKNVTLPLVRLSRTLASLAENSRDPVEIPDLERSDEIGALARAFKRALDESSALTVRARLMESRLQAILENTPAVICLRDIDGRFLLVNRWFLRLFGLREAEVMGRSASEIFPEPEAVRLQAIHRSAVRSGKPFVSELHLQVRGEDRIFRAHQFPVRDSHGRLQSVCTIAMDMTETVRAEAEKRDLESRLQQAQRLESVGRLAGGVAHDFNNMLTGIMGFAQLALSRLPADHGARKQLERIVETGERAAGLTAQLLAFSRKQRHEPRIQDLNEVVLGVGALVERVIGDAVSFAVTPAASPLYVRLDAAQIEQVLLNLAVNAKDAMPDGGVLTISVSECHVEPGDVAPATMAPGRYARIAVTDTGSGMTAEVREKAFEPFFTTKESGKGTGLGLATVYGLMQQHEGHIELESEPGRGTTFHLYLPVAPEGAGEEAPGEPEKDSGEPGASPLASILVVDDEEVVRDFLSEGLAPLGFSVRAAASGLEARDLFRSARDGFDVLLTDVEMPGLNGIDLAVELKRRDPGLKVILMSGYSERIERGCVPEGVAEAFLRKPIKIPELLETIREALGGE